MTPDEIAAAVAAFKRKGGTIQQVEENKRGLVEGNGDWRTNGCTIHRRRGEHSPKPTKKR